MRRILTISLLILLFFSQIGYYVFYLFQQYEIKEAVKHELLSQVPESLLEKIDADAKDIVWEEDREFYLHGQMYDVAYTRIVNGKKILYCLNDSKESDLNKRLAEAVDSGNEQKSANKHGHHVIKFQASDFLVLAQPVPIIDEPASIEHIDRPVMLVTNIIEIFTPPPEFILKHKTQQL